MDFDERYRCYGQLIEKALGECFAAQGLSFDGLLEAMNYSLMAGGKRIRPILTLEFCRAVGGSPEAALPLACAVELLHTYSLIHDDLPCMDDDSLRRGKLTNHVVYGQAIAILAGDALQAEAFGKILRSELPAQVRADCAQALADAAGVDGICGGQYLDIVNSGRKLTEAQLTDVHSRKTGALLIAACRLGAIAGGASPEQQEAAMFYGACLGAAFQIRDDMLDVLSTDVVLGKSVGKDFRGNKTTFMTLLGAEKCEKMLRKFTDAAKGELKLLPDAEFLCELAERLAYREK
jgi:geranylgeranyl diphosphate synthase type II